MKTKIASLLIAMFAMPAIHASEPEIAEIIDMARKRRDNQLRLPDPGDWRSSGIVFERLIVSLGEKLSEWDETEIEKLDPEQLEDRIKLIAADFVTRSEAYDKIYDKYVRHPTEEELQKMREEAIARIKARGDEIRPIQPGGPQSLLKDPQFPAPLAVEEEHLIEKFQFPLEYFWMAPHKEPVMGRYRDTLVRALDDLKEENGGLPDIRDLLE